MNTMSIIETIRAKIERYKQEAAIARFYNAGENADYFQGKVDLCDDLTYILDTLPEQPVEGLEEEINAEWKKCNPIDEGMGVESAYIHIEAFDIIARHFAEWGAEHLKK